MKVRVEEIPPEGLSLDLQEDGHRLLGRDTDPDFEEKVVSHLELHLAGESVLVSGRTQTAVLLSCSRCLEEYRFAIDSEVSLELRPVTEISAGGELQLTADEMDIEYYRGGAIDTDDILAGQVAEKIPFKPLCDDKCRGLCPQCGTNLNRGTCGCVPDAADTGFGVLRNLLKEKE